MATNAGAFSKQQAPFGELPLFRGATHYLICAGAHRMQFHCRPKFLSIYIGCTHRNTFRNT